MRSDNAPRRSPARPSLRLPTSYPIPFARVPRPFYTYNTPGVRERTNFDFIKRPATTVVRRNRGVADADFPLSHLSLSLERGGIVFLFCFPRIARVTSEITDALCAIGERTSGSIILFIDKYTSGSIITSRVYGRHWRRPRVRVNRACRMRGFETRARDVKMSTIESNRLRDRT